MKFKYQEHTMIHRLAIATAALAVLGASSVGAQPAPDRPAGVQPPAVSRDDAAAYLDAGLAALHSGLQLTPDQEHLWPGFEKAFRDFENLRQERGNPPGNEDLMARLQRRADLLSRRGAALKALADAAAPLWQSLDDGQKRRFTTLARVYYFQNFGRNERGGYDRGGVGPRGPGRGDDFGRGRFGFGGPGRDYDYGDRDRDGGRRGFGPRDQGPRNQSPRGFGGPGRGGDYGNRGFGGRDEPGRYPDARPRRGDDL
jgi:hypothetical protein